jgi:hypothetical protein
LLLLLELYCFAEIRIITATTFGAVVGLGVMALTIEPVVDGMIE